MRWRAWLSSGLAAVVVLTGTACVGRGPAPGGGEAELSAGTGDPATAAGAGLATRGAVDRLSLPLALVGAGVILPPGSNVYAAVLAAGAPARISEQFEAGGGGLASDFWPASSVKVLAAVGALAFLRTMAFTGAATVVYADGSEVAVRDLLRAAVVDSSNDAYDDLLAVAGVDWLNSSFLTPANGFATTVIQHSYLYPEVVSSPPMTFVEGDRRVSLPARYAGGGFGVPDGGNRSDLWELVDSVRRVVLDGSLPATDRFPIDAADAEDLAGDLLAAEGFIGPGAVAALGAGVRVYSKPGYVTGDACVDVAYVEDTARGHAYLLGVSVPDDGMECATLTDVARATLAFLGAV